MGVGSSGDILRTIRPGGSWLWPRKASHARGAQEWRPGQGTGIINGSNKRRRCTSATGCENFDNIKCIIFYRFRALASQSLIVWLPIDTKY